MCLEFMQLAAFLVAMVLALQTPDQCLGSFTIAGQTFAVGVRNQTQLEIRDSSNQLEYQKAIEPGVSATAKLASGSDLAGLLNRRTAPGQQCFEAAGAAGLAEVGCEMRVETSRKPGASHFTFVRVFREAAEGSARHVVIKKDANIEYLAAKAIVKWSTSGDEFSANLSDVWLKALIDNNEDNLGWIHTDEDFRAVGLPRQKVQP